MRASHVGSLACVRSLLPKSDLGAFNIVRSTGDERSDDRQQRASCMHRWVFFMRGLARVSLILHLFTDHPWTPTIPSALSVRQHMDTALHYAANYGHPDCVRALLSAGARVDTRNKVCYVLWLIQAHCQLRFPCASLGMPPGAAKGETVDFSDGR